MYLFLVLGNIPQKEALQMISSSQSNPKGILATNPTPPCQANPQKNHNLPKK